MELQPVEGGGEMFQEVSKTFRVKHKQTELTLDQQTPHLIYLSLM